MIKPTTILVMIFLGVWSSGAEAKKPEPKASVNIQSTFRDRYCKPSEKVGTELKRFDRPGLAKFVSKEAPTAEAPLVVMAKKGRSSFELKEARAWEVDLPSGKWSMASL